MLAGIVALGYTNYIQEVRNTIRLPPGYRRIVRLSGRLEEEYEDRYHKNNAEEKFVYR